MSRSITILALVVGLILALPQLASAEPHYRTEGALAGRQVLLTPEGELDFAIIEILDESGVKHVFVVDDTTTSNNLEALLFGLFIEGTRFFAISAGDGTGGIPANAQVVIILDPRP